jgi:ferritin-like metal-binding protein YciE
MIAAYTSLAVIAKAAGFNNHVSWIETSVEEENASAKAAFGIVPSVTERFLAKQQD